MPSIRISLKITENLKGLKKLGKKLATQKDAVAEVGHFDGHPHPFDTNGETIAAISLMQQQGFRLPNGRKVPARPYMLIALESPAFVKAYNEAVMKIAFGETRVSKTGKVRSVTISSELPKLARLLREVTMGVIQTSFGLTRNSDITIARKGFDHPLVETGNLVNDIEFKLSKDVGRRRDRGLNKVAQ